MGAKEIHWADLAAENLINAQDKEKYVCASGITPSGTVHIGNFREVITTDLVVKALENKGKKVSFIYSWDDYDVFRKVPENMPKQDLLNKYLRKAIVDIPDPFGCHKSYAGHNEKEFEKYLHLLNIKPRFIYQAENYKACKYVDLIDNAMKNRKKISEILNRYREEPLEENWYPASVFCSKCNTDKTKIINYENYKTTYTCECSHEETFDIRKKGIIKLLWRADWPYRWHYEKVDFEPGGKDHSTVGGSFTTACEIAKEILNKEPPQYIMYDFITIKGQGGKISSSKGNVITLKELLEIYEPEIIRWLFASTRPNTEFAISFDLDVINIYEEFDKNERIYFGKEDINISKELLEKEKRMYELSCIELQKKLPIQPGFRHITTITQIYEFDIKKTTEYFREKVETKFDENRLRIRIGCAINWLNKYAPEDFKFKINKTSSKIELSQKQKKAVELVIKILEEKELNDEELHQEFYKIIEETRLSIKEFFNLFYNIIINKERGPKLAHLILTIGKPRTIKLLKDTLKFINN